MKFINPKTANLFEYSLNDVFLLPQKFSGTSRSEVDLTPIDGFGGSNPIISANMNSVTGKRMAETIARYGGIGVLPQDMQFATLERIVTHVKTAPVYCDTALTLFPENSVREAIGLIPKRAHSAIIVVDKQRHPVGMVRVNEAKDIDQYAALKEFMIPNAVEIAENTPFEEAYHLLNEHMIFSAPVVNKEKKLVGILTQHDAIRFSMYSPSLDKQGRLMIAVALGVNRVSKVNLEKLHALEIDLLVLDTAHGHQQKMLDAIQHSREIFGPRFPIIAGNVCTAKGTRELIEAGAGMVKVNIGPGAMCTTRMKTGFGRPSFSTVVECAREARKTGHFICADGGVRYPRDISLYLAAGASRVMIGSVFAATFESPGDIKFDNQGRMYKVNYGMASAQAVAGRTKRLSPFERAKKTLYREGESSTVYFKQGRESVGAIVDEMISGLRSAYTYAGALNQEEFFEQAVVGIQTKGGFHEGTPHGID